MAGRRRETRMQKEFYHSGSPHVDHWEGMWASRTIEREQEACDMESPPRDLFLRYLTGDGRVLDSGCGFGKWLVYLARRGYDITGLDSSDLAVRGLKDFDSSLRVEVGDVLNLDCPDASFDACLSMDVVEHFEDGPFPALGRVLQRPVRGKVAQRVISRARSVRNGRLPSRAIGGWFGDGGRRTRPQASPLVRTSNEIERRLVAFARLVCLDGHLPEGADV